MSTRWVRIDPFSALYSFGVMSAIPRTPGCYVIYCDGQVSYIGQTRDLQKRIKSYRLRHAYSNSIFTPWGQFDTVVIKYRESLRYGDWAMTELRLIKRLQPPFNCAGSIRKRGAA